MTPSEQTITILEKQLQQIADLLQESELTDSQKFEEWNSSTEGILLRLFGKDSKEYKDIAHLSFTPNVISYEDDVHGPEWKEAYVSDLKKAQSRLKGTISILSVMGMPQEKPVVQKAGNSYTISPVFTNSNSQQQSQTQTVNLSQAMKEALDVVDSNYGSEKAEEARVLLSELEKEPKKWENARKVVKYFADLGRDAFVAVAPVIASTILKAP